MSDLSPVDIQRDGNSAIVITWNDGESTRWSAERLRKACPCATCREKKRKPADDSDSPDSDADQKPKPLSLPVLSAAEAQPLRIESMRPVGNYAYNIAFSDGHSSGIFTFPILHGDEDESETDA